MGFDGIVEKEQTKLDAGGTAGRAGRLTDYILGPRILGVVSLIPGVGAFEAFFEKDGGLVTEEFLGKADVGEGIADVAFARRLVFCLQSFAGGFLEHLQNLVERNGVAGADVEGASRGAGSLASESVGKHGVINIGEVTGLLAVAEDGGWSGVEKRGGKARA